MTSGRRKIALLAAGAVASAGIAAGAVAATTGGGEGAGDLAAAINERAGTSITGGDVRGAYEDLLAQRLDEAVAAGRLTRAEADEMLARAKAAPGLPGLGGPHMGRGRGPRGPHAEVLDEVAAKVGLTEAQIRQRLRNGSTLTAIAKSKGVTRAELLATIRAALRADGVPAARTAELAARIADHTHPERGERGPRGPHAEVLDEVAAKVGLTEAQIRQRLRNGSTLTAIAKSNGVTRAELIATIRAALRADGVPAARTAELAARIADHTRPERGPRGARP